MVGIEIQKGALSAGDRVAYELPVDFVEEDVTSLQIDNEAVAEAAAGVRVGMKTGLSQEQARDGVRVYRVRKPA